MAAPSDPWIPEWAMRVGELVVSGVWFVLAGIAGFMYRNYGKHIAMLRRHDRWITEGENELGLQRIHRADANKGPVGEALNARLSELAREDRTLHKRITLRRKKQEATETSIAQIKTDIIWIKEALERIEKNQSE